MKKAIKEKLDLFGFNINESLLEILLSYEDINFDGEDIEIFSEIFKKVADFKKQNELSMKA